MGPGGPISLNMLAINQGMEDYNIDEDEKVDFSLKVRRIANVILSAKAEEAAEKARRKK